MEVRENKKIQYIKSRLSDVALRKALQKVVENVDELIPNSEEEFAWEQKFGLYEAQQCVTFVTKQGTDFYQLDNMALVPKGDTDNNLRYGDFTFRQIEILFLMGRMDNKEAHFWLRDNLFRDSRVDARKKTEYKAKFRGDERADWKQIQVEWMKYCLNLKYSCNSLFRADLLRSGGKLPVEDGTNTRYPSRLFWGAELVEIDGMKYYFGCNVLGKLLAKLRDSKCKLTYTLPNDMHIFGEKVL